MTELKVVRQAGHVRSMLRPFCIVQLFSITLAYHVRMVGDEGSRKYEEVVRDFVMTISIKLPREEKIEIINDVKAYFEEERSETIGDLAAEQLIDYMITQLGPYIYNKALTDARTLINEKMNQIEDELYILEKPTQNHRR